MPLQAVHRVFDLTLPGYPNPNFDTKENHLFNVRIFVI